MTMIFQRCCYSIAVLAAVFLSFSAADPERPSYPQGYFQSPVRHKIVLSATFGELRPNHFHGGLDIKPLKGGVAGDPILAAAEGWVSRVKISSGGYGIAMYISHPNGYTTVYAHLDKISAPFDDIIKNEQYNRQSFDLDWNIAEGTIPVQRGQQIGTMGNTGGSQGVHLHFEIRHTVTDEPVNPLLFGFSVNDKIAPTVSSLRVYLLDQNRETLQAYNVAVARRSGTKYGIAKDTIYVSQPKVGLAIKTFDATSDATNQDGVFRITMLTNGNTAHRFTADRFSFNETRYLNAHLDFEEQSQRKSYFNRSWLLPGNKMQLMYSDIQNDGVLDVLADYPTEVTYIVEDYFGNSSTLQFYVAYKPKEIVVTRKNYQYILPVNEASAISREDIRFYLEPDALYETCYLSYYPSNERANDSYCSVHHVHTPRTPLHKPMELQLKPTREIPDTLRNKAFIALCGESSTGNYGGSWQDGWLITHVEQFGSFCIMLDTVAPRITPVSFAANMANARHMSFKIADNYPIKGRNTPVLRYNAWVDDQWILFEHDSKSQTITHRFDGRIGSGPHRLRLEATDNRGNTRVWEADFVR
jgi:hypothetical protein